MIAFSNSEVGIDIEYLDKDIEDNLSSMVFSATEMTEYNYLQTPKDKLEYFYNIWTNKKEAYLKNLSIGLINDLGSITVTSDEKTVIPANNKHCCIEKIEIAYNYVAYVSSLRKEQI